MLGSFTEGGLATSSAITKKSTNFRSVFKFGHFKDSSSDFKIDFFVAQLKNVSMQKWSKFDEKFLHSHVKKIESCMLRSMHFLNPAKHL